MNAIPEPLRLHSETVRPEWIDYNGHMNVAYYVLAFDHATDALLDRVGLGHAWLEAENRSVFVVEAHVNYLREVREGDPLAFETLVLGADGKRFHLFHTMRHGTRGWIAATNELMLVHVDMRTRLSAPMTDDHARALAELAALHAGVARPPQVGRSIGLPGNRAPGQA
ncbi:thioesterase family protein [Arenibaculum sp.]|jgi:acyl-CoA thioester hydrolase|uniref:thioesterase family protein n=1 Tax=Arenibaculum sp. TaxID=2865862 RepID=UPI002E11C807|nr:thioesterase family protein [Arenibaculum sp.]